MRGSYLISYLLSCVETVESSNGKNLTAIESGRSFFRFPAVKGSGSFGIMNRACARFMRIKTKFVRSLF